MSNDNLAEIKSKITIQHDGDDNQLKVIFSDSSRLLVEAPAGYGKTTTMISRLAYLFATNRIPNPKRILCLAFSVNAALKVKREVAAKLPTLLSIKNNPVAIGEKITVTNYHGFCKGILKKYGYLISDMLRKDINNFQAINESDIEKLTKLTKLKTILTTDELSTLKGMETAVKDTHTPDAQTINTYNNIIIKKLLPLDYITHNAVILFVLEILLKFEEIKKFYQGYYSLVVVDEFQDTNCIAWALLELIISDKTQLLFLGDPLQRIYGFIGALPDIMPKVIDKYEMTKVSLSKNYRFKDNREMLKLDMNIRANAINGFTPMIAEDDVAKLPAFWGISQQDESIQIAEKVQYLLNNDETTKIAILLRGRGKNTEVMETELSSRKIPYFYGMFTDEDTDYINFHNKCKDMFFKQFGKQKVINKKSLVSFLDGVKKEYATENGKAINSLLKLLDALVKKVSIDYSDLVPEDKYTLLMDIFENKQLKQTMEYVDSRVILSTIHGAKGLEWDYVILGDIERWVFPGYNTCKDCINKFSLFDNCRCTLPTTLSPGLKETILDELSVFYVGITRAKKQAYVAASANRLDKDGNTKPSLFSCMVGLNGVKLVKAK